MKNKKSLIIAIAVVVVVLVGISLYVLSTRKTASTQSQEMGIEVESIPAIAPKEIGLSMEMGANDNTVIVTIENTEDISTVEFELSYTSKGDIPRGGFYQAEIKDNNKPFTAEYTLGTCSDVCHYDQDVKDIKLIAKITKTNGKVFQSELSL